MLIVTYLIKIGSNLSSRIIKKGDFFTIYIDITNGHEGPIDLREVKISQPMGFYPVTMERLKKLQMPGFARLSELFGKLSGSAQSVQPRREDDPNFSFEEMHEKIRGGSIIHEMHDAIIQKNTAYTEIFTLQAGSTAGLHPRPDTYTIRCDVTYVFDGNIFHSSIEIDVSIFPSLSSMLVGTLVGAVLGTMLKELFSKTNLMKDFDTLGVPGTLAPMIPILFSNMILGFMIAVVLMRKKDVQPFLTIEDFWGGILVGFLTSYTSSQILEQLSQMNIINTP